MQTQQLRLRLQLFDTTPELSLLYTLLGHVVPGEAAGSPPPIQLIPNSAPSCGAKVRIVPIASTCRASRFERGDSELLHTIREMSRFCPVALSITVVQPGLSQQEASRDQLELLSVTENHLYETFRIPFKVIGSA